MNGTELKKLRKESGLSIIEIGAALNVTKQLISAWERGIKPIPEKRALEIEEIMKDPIQYKRFKETLTYEEYMMLLKMRKGNK